MGGSSGTSGPEAESTVRVTGVLKAKPGMSAGEFEERWLEGHVIPYSLRAFPRLVGLRCNVAVQCHVGEQGFDGTQDLWWASREDMEADLGSPLRAEVSAHVREFCEPIDLAVTEYRFKEDPGNGPGEQGLLESVPEPTPGVKVVALLTKNPGAAPVGLESELIDDHLQRFAAQLQNLSGLRACLVDEQGGSDLQGQPFDAIEELWWVSEPDFEADKTSEQGRAAHRNMWRFMTAVDLVTKEYIFI